MDYRCQDILNKFVLQIDALMSKMTKAFKIYPVYILEKKPIGLKRSRPSINSNFDVHVWIEVPS